MTLSQGSIPLPARGVQFSVVSGDFRFIVESQLPGELLAAAVSTATDQGGRARARPLPVHAEIDRIGEGADLLLCRVAASEVRLREQDSREQE